MLRRLYDWCVGIAGKPYAAWVLGAVAFADSSFFPIIPDVMLIPMALARPDRAWFFAGVCTIASVLGGIFGYFIGAVLYDTLGHWLIQLYGYGDKVEAFRAGLRTIRRAGDPHQRVHADPLQTRHHHFGLCRIQIFRSSSCSR